MVSRTPTKTPSISGRSAPGTSGDAEYEEIIYPTQRLAAVTRVANQVDSLISDLEDNENAVGELIDKLKNKIFVFVELCEEEATKYTDDETKSAFLRWFAEKRDHMKNSESSFIRTLEEYRLANVGDSASVLSVCNSVSSVREKLEEKRAHLFTEKKFFKESLKLEQQQRELKKALKELELRKKEEECKRLDDALSGSDGPPVQNFSQNEILRKLVEAHQQSFLPRHFPETFDGSDVTKYRRFKLSFKQMIEQHCHEEGRFHYLLQYTTGYANDLVSSCYSENTNESYLKAMEVLDEKYGDSYVISHAYLKKLRNWPEIKPDDGKALEELSLYLTGCHNMMSNVSYLRQLDNHEEIKSVVDKLPIDMRKSWRSLAVCKIEMGEEVDFGVLEKFISRQCKVLNSPIFGNVTRETIRESKTGYKHKVMATIISKNSEELICLCCKKLGSHNIDKCFFFKKKSFDEKRKFIRENALCFGCLSVDHQYRNCDNKLTCSVCQMQHPTCMHKEPIGTFNEGPVVSECDVNNAIVMTVKSEPSLSQSSKQRRVLSPAVPVLVRFGGSAKTVRTYAALDPWASDCFVSSELLSKLDGVSRAGRLNMATMHSVSVTGARFLSNIEVSNLENSVHFTLPDVYALKQWPFDVYDVPTQESIIGYDHLTDIDFNFVPEKIGLLVGANMPDVIQPLEIVSGGKCDIFATRYALGWAITGSLKKETNPRSFCHRVKISELEDVEQKLDLMFASDFIDTEPDSKGSSVEDKLWSTRVSDSIKVRDDGHYEIGLPFRDMNVEMPCNYKQALGCFMGLKKRFVKNASFFEDYRLFIENMIAKGYLELVPESEVDAPKGKRWYLVHHGVYHKTKNKIRVVFDCSKQNAGVSLNDVLLKGPDLMNNLAGVLIRFRNNKIAIIADIESMFMQVKVPVNQRDFMRLFWFENGELNNKILQYRLTSHTFGAVCSPSIVNFALRKSAVDNTGGFSDESCNAIINSTYVDDVMFGAASDMEAIDLMRETRNLVSSAGFNLTGIVSNSRIVLSAFPTELLGKNLKEFDVVAGSLPSDRALGVQWDVDGDSFFFEVRPADKPPTRRGMLSVICSIFDPLGLVSPITVVARSLFQETCRRKLAWDDDLPEDLKSPWLRWLKSLQLMSSFTFDRYVVGSRTEDCDRQMHVFCDGSLKAYGAVAYLRSVDSGGIISCNILMSKVRQTPIGNSSLRTVPRIELNSAKVAVLLKVFLFKEMSVDIPVYFWSDSMTVLKYIKNETVRFNRFVENRINLIRSNSNPLDWRHVPGKINVADVLSRGASIRELSSNTAWKNGPEFLCEHEPAWPVQNTVASVGFDDVEVHKESRVAVVIRKEEEPFDKLLNCSSWFRILVRVSVFLSFVKYLRSREIVRPQSRDALTRSEVVVWLYVQRDSYSEQIASLKRSSNLRRNDPLERLNPVIDEAGLIRVQGRLDCSEEPYSVRHPIILPGKSKTVGLMITNLHHRMGHMGKNYLLSSLRCKYWVVNKRAVINDILRKCVQCRKLHGKTSQAMMAPLPADRVTGHRPAFFATGVDFFGPFITTRGRSKCNEKRYGVVFSCLASRAVHFEISYSLTTDSFINCLRRFVSRRGQVKEIYSDNGTNLVGGSRELRKSLNGLSADTIGNHLTKAEISWHFSPPYASNFNGAWEREIRTCRKILEAIINAEKHFLTDEMLTTFLCEAEYIMNSRPLTPVSADVSDLRALTPNHLLLVSPEPQFPIGDFADRNSYVRNRWRRVQHLAESFWLRWRREYLVLLNERQKWRKDKITLKKGDLVLVTNVLLPRSQWCMGRIVEENVSPIDGKTRSVKLKVAKTSPKGSTPLSTEIIRPISKLIYLMSS